jgi:hypothetical protein
MFSPFFCCIAYSLMDLTSEEISLSYETACVRMLKLSRALLSTESADMKFYLVKHVLTAAPLVRETEREKRERERREREREDRETAKQDSESNGRRRGPSEES